VAKKRGGLARSLMVAAMIVVAVPVVQTVIYRFVPPPVTILMLTRLFEGKGLKKSWRPIERISPRLADAVIAAEDSGFCDHHGFDFAAMEKAAEANERHPGKIRGGSTISQQTAKNVFLWPGRDYVRKGLEAGYTVLIEAIWGKRRILETYLNVVEWGPGIYGAQAASQSYFHVDADRLSPDQAARLAAVLPSPLKWKAAHPGRYVARRSGKIVARAAVVREDDLSACVR
jgi:monofunctional biosynthetic peptidoglycan transglycosylase